MEKDLLLAKEILEKEELSLVFVKNGEVLFKSDKKGIRPLLDAYSEKREELSGSYLADKMIGRAATAFIMELDLGGFFAKVISTSALDYLGDKEIKYYYDQKIERVLNRDQTDLCPMEKISLKSNDNKEIIEKIKEFLKEV